MSQKSVIERNDWVFGNRDKFSISNLQNTYERKFLLRMLRIFEYEGLPETIPQKDLELILLVEGHGVITKVDGELYCFRAGLGGIPNVYYLPTIAVVANPALKYSKSLKIGSECVLIKNDSLYKGIMDIITQASYLLAQCDMSFKWCAINSRVPALVSAGNDQTKLDIDTMFDQIEKGEKLAVIADKDLISKMQVSPYANQEKDITSLIELKQYIMGIMFQDLGIKAPFNMKREAINEAEAALSDDLLLPYVDEMLITRQLWVEDVNRMYGTNITVKLNSAWEEVIKRKELAEDLIRSEIDENKTDDSGSKENNRSFNEPTSDE